MQEEPKEITFRYFRAPHQFSTYQVQPGECEICHRERPGYTGYFSGEEDLEFICEECLSNGSLAKLEMTANEADRSTLRQQLAEIQPELDMDVRNRLFQERTAELEERTPHLVTWQGFFWPAHCGDYACFIKEAGKSDLNQLDHSENGQTFFTTHLYEKDKNDTAIEVWDLIRPDAPQDNATSYDIGVYLFQCLVCQEYLILWDSN